jgi:hypothetical protein
MPLRQGHRFLLSRPGPRAEQTIQTLLPFMNWAGEKER